MGEIPIVLASKTYPLSEPAIPGAIHMELALAVDPVFSSHVKAENKLTLGRQSFAPHQVCRCFPMLEPDGFREPMSAPSELPPPHCAGAPYCFSCFSDTLVDGTFARPFSPLKLNQTACTWVLWTPRNSPMYAVSHPGIIN